MQPKDLDIEQAQRFRNLRHEQNISGEAMQKALRSIKQISDPAKRAEEMAKIEKGVGLWAYDAMKEDINDRLGRMEADRAAGRPANPYRPGDWGDMQVASQIDAMGMDRFEVGVLKDKRMSLEEMDKHEVIYNAANLRRLNVGGADIHIRPKEKDGYSLSLVDDVSEATLKRMKGEGFTPALVVRTSPGNYQAWMKHHESLTQEVASAAGRAIAERFGADIGGAPAGHMGR